MICMSQNNSRRKGVITENGLVTCKAWYYKLTTEVWSEVKWRKLPLSLSSAEALPLGIPMKIAIIEK